MRFLLLFFFVVASLYGALIGIDFKGNKTFTKEELYIALGIEQKWWQKLLFSKEKPKVDEKLLPIIFEKLQDFYKDQGFWHAKIDITLQDHVVLFQIEENTPITIKKIQITSDFDIEQYIQLQEKDRFIASKFKEAKSKIKKALLKAGYCSYEFNPKAYIYEKSNKAFLTFYLEKGSICHIGKISLHGLDRVKPQTVLSHLYFKPGDPFYFDLIRESYNRLYSLGYFRMVHIDYSKKLKNNILMDINLKERTKRNVYKAGVGYDTQNGFHLNLFYKHLNFYQFQSTINLFYSDIKKEGSFSLFYPSLLIAKNSFDTVTTLGYEQNKYDGFDQRGNYFRFKLLKTLYHIQGSLQINLEQIQIDRRNNCTDTKSYTLLYPDLMVIYDQRDSKLSPTKGYYLKDSLAISLTSYNFVKNQITAGVYLPIDRFTLFAKATFGTIFASDLPPNKLFYAGGINSNRAYTFRSITVRGKKCKIGGKTLFETTLEPRFHYNAKTQIALFWDRTYLSSDQFKFDSYVDGVGAGILYNTPLGLLRLYMGFDPKDPSKNALNIFLGASF